MLSESHVGFRRGRGTVVEIRTLRILEEKVRDTGIMLIHNFIDFRKAFDRIWHEAVRRTMMKYNIGEGLTTLIQNLYEGAKSKMLVNDHYSDWFRPTVGENKEGILEVTRRLEEALKRYGMEISTD
ncbi:uncharacterized protein LOC122263516 [Penaeus japonicus]|uniref:uncharacterized protein LOC122263516 n=1 Tax=Penaeus japonicus TaxID=27405 RepID=UPI001C71710C|nr:uncharacterized protein LOC122263516 [Penaeus japonicus]